MFYAMIDSTDVDGCYIFKTGGHAYIIVLTWMLGWGNKTHCERL
jgi:hypothetical protein